MAEGFKPGQMGHDMLVNGQRIGFMGLGSSGMRMGTSSRGTSRMSRQMGMAFSCIRTGLDMKDNGKMTFKME